MFYGQGAPMICGMETLGDRIQSALDAKQWRPNRLAAELDVDTDTVRRWLRGLNKPRVDDVQALAKALNVSFSWLLTGKEEKFDTATRASIWEGLQGALDRLAVLRQKKMTEAVRSQIDEVEQGITLAQQLLGLTSGQAAALSEAAAASSEAESLRVDAPDEDQPEPEEDEPPTPPSA